MAFGDLEMGDEEREEIVMRKVWYKVSCSKAETRFLELKFMDVSLHFQLMPIFRLTLSLDLGFLNH